MRVLVVADDQQLAVVGAGALRRDRSSRRGVAREVDRPLERERPQTTRGAGYRLAVHGG